jgi:hypothetical protein
MTALPPTSILSGPAATMTLWEFALRGSDGTVFEQTVIAEGADEEAAAASAAAMIVAMAGTVLARPGVAVAAARWREVVGAFPALVSDRGRLARYARGLPFAIFLLAALGPACACGSTGTRIHDGMGPHERWGFALLSCEHLPRCSLPI